VYPSEVAPITKMGKKVVAARALPAGHVLRPEDVCLKSPGDGLPPYELEKVIGATLLQPLNADDEIAYQLLKRTPELARS
jgi:N-acetylneuraminate synthase/sialic acid synthase